MAVEENYEKALRAAIRLFSKYGAERTTMAMVSKEVGVSTRSIFRYFGTKDQLVLEVVRWGVNRMKDSIKKLINSSGYQNKNGYEQLLEIYRLLLIIAENDYEYYVCVAEIETYLVRNCACDIYEQYNAGNDSVIKIAADAKNKGLNDGSINQIYRSDDLFDTLNIAVRGFFYRVALNTYCDKIDKGSVNGIRNNYFELVERVLAS